MRFTPHGIEDILRIETKIVVDGDCGIDSEVDSYHGRDSEVNCCRERDSPSPLNLSKGYLTETNSKQVIRETETTQGEKILRRKKMRTTFTGRQIFELERMFETKKYLNAGERNNLSRSVVIVMIVMIAMIVSWSALF